MHTTGSSIGRRK
uniref:Uncharacterized protein n=1 Tax=Rhizophora mucronata TaxID=61149 RepID=A0A2P2QX06_RHIMU